MLILPIDLPLVSADAARRASSRRSTDARAAARRRSSPTGTAADERAPDRPAGRDRVRASAATAGPPTRPRAPRPAPASSSSTGRSPSTSTRPDDLLWSRQLATPRRPMPADERPRRGRRPRRHPRDRRRATTSPRSIGDAIERTAGVLPLRDGRRPRRDPEGRLEGRGRHRRPDDGRAAPRGGRVRRALGPRRRARSRSSCARRAASSGWRTACSSPRRRTASSAPTAASTRRTSVPASGHDRDAPAARSGRLGRRGSGAPSGARFGVDVPVIVSRLVRPAVALGHRRCRDRRVRPARRSRTCAATPDADGRVMQSTVRAVADEIASAAELALGKTTARPVALVRGANPPRGEASIRDALMPRGVRPLPLSRRQRAAARRWLQPRPGGDGLRRRPSLARPSPRLDRSPVRSPASVARPSPGRRSTHRRPLRRPPRRTSPGW